MDLPNFSSSTEDTQPRFPISGEKRFCQLEKTFCKVKAKDLQHFKKSSVTILRLVPPFFCGQISKWAENLKSFNIKGQWPYLLGYVEVNGLGLGVVGEIVFPEDCENGADG